MFLDLDLRGREHCACQPWTIRGIWVQLSSNFQDSGLAYCLIQRTQLGNDRLILWFGPA